MLDQLQTIQTECSNAIKSCQILSDVEKIRVEFLGRKGKLPALLKQIVNLSDDKKKEIGQKSNQVKQDLEKRLNNKIIELEGVSISEELKNEWIDVTQPSINTQESGHLHPLTQVQKAVEDIFVSMGFMVLDGPELESEYYNFEALNIPSWHPARDIQDTFYVKSRMKNEELGIKNDDKTANKLLMRTQTSPVQIRAMQKYGAPIRAIVPGRCFRSEATDACHDHTFDQVEGLLIDKNITVANLIYAMKTMLSGVFERDVKVRLRPGYFPFVEPGFELDINCLICNGKGCPSCKHSGWLELVPCGMVHPNVLKYGGIDPKKYSGFAFGLGLTRLVMMKYGIDDIRLLLNGDLRFLRQF
ncbi:phenylalanine--tRNA ligase subunit alpha [bacterium]|nr:MAG: phenylalanine--tRNA ligase subunit alpha [bacterium]